MRLRLKIFIYVILSTSIIYLLSVGYVNLRYWNYTREMGVKLANMYTKQSAITAQSTLNYDLRKVETLAEIFSSFKDFEKTQRMKFYRKFLIDILEHNPNYLSVWMSWELSAIDPNWALPYGRERTYVFREQGNIKIVTDSTDMDGDVPGGNFYLLKSGVEKSLFTDPYFFSYTQDAGSAFLETTISKGIYEGNKFVGAVGVDFSLQNFQKLLSELKPFDNSKILIVSNNGTIAAHEDTKIVGQKISKVYPEYNSYRLIEKIKKGLPFFFSTGEKEKQNKYLSFYPIKLEDSNMPWSLGFIVSYDIITKNVKNDFGIVLIISVVSLLLISIINWSVISTIINPIEKTSKTLEALSEGKVLEEYKIRNTSKDEIGKMIKIVNNLVDSLKRTQLFAIEIGKGNLEVGYKMSSDSDILGKSLLEMRDNLLKIRIEEKERIKQSTKISWTQNGITEINEILREYSNSVEELSGELIKFLVKYTNSVQGGFYLLELQEGERKIILKSAYAFDRKKELSAIFEIGEGLIGRAVKEKQVVVLEDLPEGYLFVRSGLGEKSPDKLVIIPLIFEETVLGTIELAGFTSYDKFKIDFLEQVAIRITSSVSVLLKNLETASLLKESQLQTATFEIKEKQFIRQRKKLMQRQKEYDIKTKELETSFNVLREIGLYLEITEEKIITDTNSFILNVFKIEKEQLLGKSIEDISKFSKASKVFIDKFWNDIFNGMVRKKITTYFWNDFELNITDLYFKVKTKDGFKIIILGIT